MVGIPDPMEDVWPQALADWYGVGDRQGVDKENLNNWIPFHLRSITMFKQTVNLLIGGMGGNGGCGGMDSNLKAGLDRGGGGLW